MQEEKDDKFDKVEGKIEVPAAGSKDSAEDPDWKATTAKKPQ